MINGIMGRRTCDKLGYVLLNHLLSGFSCTNRCRKPADNFAKAHVNQRVSEFQAQISYKDRKVSQNALKSNFESGGHLPETVVF